MAKASRVFIFAVLLLSLVGTATNVKNMEEHIEQMRMGYASSGSSSSGAKAKSPMDLDTSMMQLQLAVRKVRNGERR